MFNSSIVIWFYCIVCIVTLPSIISRDSEISLESHLSYRRTERFPHIRRNEHNTSGTVKYRSDKSEGGEVSENWKEKEIPTPIHNQDASSRESSFSKKNMRNDNNMPAPTITIVSEYHRKSNEHDEEIGMTTSPQMTNTVLPNSKQSWKSKSPVLVNSQNGLSTSTPRSKYHYYTRHKRYSGILSTHSQMVAKPTYTPKNGTRSETSMANPSIKQQPKHLFRSLYQDPSSLAYCGHCRLFVGTRELNYTQYYPFSLPQTSAFDVTVITTSTLERLYFLPMLMERWEGFHLHRSVISSHYSIAVLTQPDQVDTAVSRIKELRLPERFRIILYITDEERDPPGVFPINKLRNIAIVNIQTTHFLVLDMDMWPAPTLYQELLSVPKPILESKENAVIVPAFFLNKNRVLHKCTDILSCANVSNLMFPKTVPDLLTCIKRKRCKITKGVGLTHQYITPKWFNMTSEVNVVQLSCFPNRQQEPYIMYRYTDNTLLFDERFVDYGCNKVQYIEHLRKKGSRFYVLTTSFAMDIAHHDSPYRARYMKDFGNHQAPFMKKGCNQYIALLDKAYKGIYTRLCKKGSELYQDVQLLFVC